MQTKSFSRLPKGSRQLPAPRLRARHVLSALPLQQESDATSHQGLILARKAKEPRSFAEAYPIAGVTFEGRQELVKQLQPNQILMLEREPWNEYDPNAVRVMDLSGRTLGYIPRKNDANTHFKHASQFALVASMGPVQDGTQFGARIYARSRVPNLMLDPLPAADAARFADVPAILGDRWPAAMAATMAGCNYRCEITGIAQAQSPLVFVPQWRYNVRSQTVQLTRLVVMCQSLAAAKSELEKRLAALAQSGKEEMEVAGALKELAASPEGYLFTEINGLDEQDAVQYFEVIRRRCQAVADQTWGFEVLLV